MVRRSLFKSASIAFYCLLVFMCSMYQATQKEENFTQNTITIFDRMNPDLCTLILHKYLTLKDAMNTRNISTFFSHFTPVIEQESIRYFRPFLNYIYYKNIGFSVEKYCLQLEDLYTLSLIHNHMDSHYKKMLKFKNIYLNSCVFLLCFGYCHNQCIIFGGRGYYEDKIAVSHILNTPLFAISMNERAMVIVISVDRLYGDGFKYFRLGDPNFGGQMHAEVKSAGKGILISALSTTHTCGIWNIKSKQIHSWGNFHTLDEISPPEEILENVENVKNNGQFNAFSALLSNKTIIAWGNPKFGGKIPDHLKVSLRNVVSISTTRGAFAVLTNNGQIFSWGDPKYGGQIPELLLPLLQNVKKIIGNANAFAVLTNDGKAFAWRDPTYYTGNKIQNKLVGVLEICTYGSYKFVAYFYDDSYFIFP